MKYLKDIKYYEDRYDDITISVCRSQERICIDAFHSAKKSLKPLAGKDKNPEHELMKAFNLHRYFMVEWTAGERWEKRDTEIQEMMDADEAKDSMLANARLTSEPICMHCSKTGLRILSKDLMHRGENYKYDDPEEVLIMLECPSCKKRSAYWEDGEQWERLTTKCPKCRAIMKETARKTDKSIITTYSCPECRHVYKDTLDLSTPRKQKEKPDPNYAEDKKRFCLSDEEGKKYQEARRNWDGLQSVLEDMQERQNNKHIYEAVKEMRKPKIAELTPILSPSLEKAGYIEFHLDKPEMGRDVYVGFSCLDSKSDRGDYDSEKTLKKTVELALKETNWRLMSDGIRYRLGYLSGRLRAYEREEDLKTLVDKRIKAGDLKPKPRKTPKGAPNTLYAPDGTKIIL